jgi:hypothetical protein
VQRFEEKSFSKFKFYTKTITPMRLFKISEKQCACHKIASHGPAKSTVNIFHQWGPTTLIAKPKLPKWA